MARKTGSVRGRTTITADQAREPLLAEAARMAREGRPLREISEALAVPVSTVHRWLQRMDISIAGRPDERTRLAEAALRAAAMCVEQAMAALPDKIDERWQSKAYKWLVWKHGLVKINEVW